MNARTNTNDKWLAEGMLGRSSRDIYSSRGNALQFKRQAAAQVQPRFRKNEEMQLMHNLSVNMCPMNYFSSNEPYLDIYIYEIIYIATIGNGQCNKTILYIYSKIIGFYFLHIWINITLS